MGSIAEGEEYEAGVCCRLCVGEPLQRKMDTQLPGWAALPLGAEGDEEAEGVALKDDLAVLALEASDASGTKEGAGSGRRWNGAV